MGMLPCPEVPPDGANKGEAGSWVGSVMGAAAGEENARRQASSKEQRVIY